MNFFERQAQARRTSGWLRILFIAAVIIVVLAVDEIVLGVVTIFTSVKRSESLEWPGLAAASQHAGLVFWTTVITAAIILFSSLAKTLQLRAGGKAVASAVHATPVKNPTEDIARGRLINIVEEMAIAASVPPPALYVLEQEPAINAFAAGFTAADAALVVTRGAVENLNRDELQAVIGHEFSHMLNGDTWLNMRLMGMLHGLFAVRSMALGVFNRIPRSEESNGVMVAVLASPILLIAAAGYIGSFAGRALQSGISRARESLADASAVQFTRNPEALKNALLKIDSHKHGSTLSSSYADGISHMLFASVAKRFFATHPTIEARIRAIDERFGELEAQQMRATKSRAQERYAKEQVLVARELQQKKAAFVNARVDLKKLSPDPQVGMVATPGVELADQVRTVVQTVIAASKERNQDVRATFFAFLLDLDPEVRARQFAFLSRQAIGHLIPKIEAALKITDTVKPMHRFPALMKQYAALRQLPTAERIQMLGALNGMLQREGQADLNVYATRKLAQVLLRDELNPAQRVPLVRLEAARADVQLLLAVVAQQSQADDELIRAAYAAGLQQIFPQSRPLYEPPVNWWSRMDMALTRLDRLAPTDKGMLINALAATILHDQQIAIGESELMRVVCATLHCPLPPSVRDHQG